MSLTINLNSAAATARRMLSSADNNVTKSITRLSSGYKINNAADDPAGLVISEKLRAQIGGLQQAIRNASDAVNMIKTAEGALDEVSSLLLSMRDLAVHAANTGATDEASIVADQNQVRNAIESLNKIASETQFGKKKLLDGSAGMRALVTSSNDVTSGNFSYAESLKAGDIIKINVTQTAEKASIKTTADISGGVGTSGFFYVNGSKVEYSSADTNVTIVDKINSLQDATSVHARIDAATGGIIFNSVEYGSEARINIVGLAAALNGTPNVSAVGVDVQAQVTTDAGNISDASWTNGKGMILQDSLGNTINMTMSGATTAGLHTNQFQLSDGTLSFQVGAYAGQTRQLSIPSIFAKDLGTSAVIGQSLSSIDLEKDPQSAIMILDAAIQDISSIRADLGATQTNVFESSINSLTVAEENISASESTIRDTDMAAEMTELTKSQILQQASTAMLAQANQTPQSLLKLLE